MKPGFKFSLVFSGILLICGSSLFPAVVNSSSGVQFLSDTQFKTLGAIGLILAFHEGNIFVSALPPGPPMFERRLGAPMPELGHPMSVEDEDSEEDDEEIIESGPRVEPHITPLNRDQCLAKLLCGMSVPVTGGNPKRNYYNEYANTVSKFFEAFPLEEDLQSSKESIETYDDYSNEDDDKPTRINHRRKPLNSSKVEATAPKLHLFDLALVDVAKPEEMSAKNRTKKEAIEKVPKKRRNRTARARKLVENLGQKLQTVRQCQSIDGCPFTFKELREKLKQKEAQKASLNNVPLPGPVFSAGTKHNVGPPPATSGFLPKPYEKPESKPRPQPSKLKPEPLYVEPIFPKERERPEPMFPHKDINKGDDELEEIFGSPKVPKRPFGFHQGVDENYNYEYNPDRPWRPGSASGNSYGYRPWKQQQQKRPPPPQKLYSEGNADKRPRPPQQRPRPRPQQNGSGSSAAEYLKRRPPPSRPGQHKPAGSFPPAPVVVQQAAPKRPIHPPKPATTTKKPSAFPKKKISYLSSPYKKPSNSGEDDEGLEDINKVAPVELIGNSDVGERESATTRKTTTEAPEEVTEGTTKKSKKKNDDSDEYEDDDDYSDENDDAQDESEEYNDEESEEDEDEKKVGKKKRKKEKKKTTVAKDESSSTTVASTSLKKIVPEKDSLFDDENEGVSEIWTKLNFATTGANQKPLERLKKKEKEKITEADENAGKSTEAAVSDEESAEDDDDDEDEEEEDAEAEGLKGSLTTLQKVRASSSSASNEDEADDEVDDENQSKGKKHKKVIKPTVSVNDESEDIDPERNMRPKLIPSVSNPVPEDDVSPHESKGSSKKAKKKKKPVKKGSSEEEDDSAAAAEAVRRKNVMMEIGGRPLVPKPDNHEQSNAHKTSSLITNRFKFQFINPYMGGPPVGATQPMDGPPGAYSAPLRTSFGNSGSSASSQSSGGMSPGGSALSAAASALPFKIKLNAGPLGNLAGGVNGPSMISLGGFGGGGGSSSASLEMPDPHHPPPPTPFPSHGPHGPNTFSRNDIPPPHQQQMGHHHQQHQPPQGFPPQQPGGLGMGLSGLGGGANSLFKYNPIPALANLFKKPSQDGIHEGHNAPPMNAFIHRPVGPESSQYRKERPSPANGSSNPEKKKGSKKGSKSKKGKGKSNQP